MARVELRPTVAADFLALQGAPPQFRCRCFTAIVDGRVIGIGGLVHMPNGEIWASVVMAAEAHNYPVAIHRAGLLAIERFKALGLKRVLASAEPDNPAAERWLQRLGFAAIEIGRHRVFVWTGE